MSFLKEEFTSNENTQKTLNNTVPCITAEVLFTQRLTVDAYVKRELPSVSHVYFQFKKMCNIVAVFILLLGGI